MKNWQNLKLISYNTFTDLSKELEEPLGFAEPMLKKTLN